MSEMYALILADRGAEILARALGREIDSFQAVVDVVPAAGCACGGPGPGDMLTAIEFKGSLDNGERLSGLIMAGQAGAQALAGLAKACGLGQDRLKADEVELLAEFMNIVVGLTAADWAVRGLEISFTPPLKKGFDPDGRAEKVNQINLGGRPEDSLTLMLMFDAQKPLIKILPR